MKRRARPGTKKRKKYCRGTPLTSNPYLLATRSVGTPALILSLFVVTSLPGCGVLPGTGGKDGDPPWILAMGANVAPGVPSIQNPGVGMTGGGSVGGVPVTGMFFFHPDHLGSITMITDGAGNPASGPEPGTSFVSYEPYGSIIRNDSYGPDIFRYKFTGQIEDKETGLYYYKSRFYEPILGRFIQADSQVMPTNVNGMNRYMYVDGNPVNYRDVSGHVSGSGLMHMVNRIIGHAMGKDFNSKGLDKRLSTGGVKKGFDKYIGKNGVLGYLGDHLVTAPLKRLIIGYKAKPTMEKKTKLEFRENVYAELLSADYCHREPDFSFAIKTAVQATLMKPILAKYIGDIEAHSSSHVLLNFFKLSGILTRDKSIAEGAACQ
ncbi:RHS repeat domain-containing protein [Leptospira noguchii]|uniref:RHS repeat domain-containing protein n=1 Tax=Leptospira noguchii TaxID=28182 RepID=UPI001F342226|nr:RHS repeat-associated core domain-containing protein [Leptospira noguchii]